VTAPIYGSEALRRLREQQAAAQEPERQTSLLEQIPADAPMDDATLTVWDGARFVAYDKWLATAPLIVEERLRQREAGIRKGGGTHETADLPPQDSTLQKGLWDTNDAVDLDGR
jgi:hypothetical protein